MSSALLLNEPEEATRSFLERHLRQDGFDVVGAENGEALDLLEQARPDLVLIGDPEGPELCRRLREGEPGRSWDREVPVILLGRAESDPVDRVRAFDRGCDDYLDRPFHYDELVARIRAVLRRVAPPEVERLEAGEIEIDRPTRRVTVSGERVMLPTKEYELLREAGRATRTGSSRRTSCSETSGASGHTAARGRWTRTPRACAAASAARASDLRPERLGRRLLPARRLKPLLQRARSTEQTVECSDRYA